MSTFPQTIPHANACDVLRNSHGVILNELDVSRLSAAIQGINAITAVLQQRELDAELKFSEGLTFGPRLAQGLISALATCTEYVSDTIDSGGVLGLRADFDTPAYADLVEASQCVTEAKSKEANHA